VQRTPFTRLFSAIYRGLLTPQLNFLVGGHLVVNDADLCLNPPGFGHLPKPQPQPGWWINATLSLNIWLVGSKVLVGSGWYWENSPSKHAEILRLFHFFLVPKKCVKHRNPSWHRVRSDDIWPLFLEVGKRYFPIWAMKRKGPNWLFRGFAMICWGRNRIQYTQLFLGIIYYFMIFHEILQGPLLLKQPWMIQWHPSGTQPGEWTHWGDMALFCLLGHRLEEKYRSLERVRIWEKIVVGRDGGDGEKHKQLWWQLCWNKAYRISGELFLKDPNGMISPNIEWVPTQFDIWWRDNLICGWWFFEAKNPGNASLNQLRGQPFVWNGIKISCYSSRGKKCKYYWPSCFSPICHQVWCCSQNLKTGKVKILATIATNWAYISHP